MNVGSGSLDAAREVKQRVARMGGLVVKGVVAVGRSMALAGVGAADSVVAAGSVDVAKDLSAALVAGGSGCLRLAISSW